MLQIKATHRAGPANAAPNGCGRINGGQETPRGKTRQGWLTAVGGVNRASSPHAYTDSSHTHQPQQRATHMSNLPIAMSSIVNFMTLAKMAIDARDWSKLAEISAKFNDQIIKAQQAVIDAQGTQSDLVAKLTQANKEITELKATLAEQARHHLEEIAPGKFALRVDLPGQDQQRLVLDGASQPKHYACQRCFAVTGKSIILQYTHAQADWRNSEYLCTACGTVLEA